MDLQSEVLLPDSVILGLLFIGIVLCLRRPHWAFLFGTFLSIAIDARTLFHSRLSGLGEYFNMSDGCMLICVAAGVADCTVRRKVPRIPPVPIAIFAVLLIGYLNSTLSYGYSYGALRGLRWSLNLPILYVVSANLLDSEKRIRHLFLTLFVGALLAELQHLRLVLTNLDVSGGNENELRLIAFMFAHSESWVIAGPYIVAGRVPKVLLQLAAAMLFLLANVTHQTRSLAIAAICAICIYYAVLMPGQTGQKMRRFAPLLAVIALGFAVAVPQLGFTGFVDSYIDRMEQLAPGGTSGRHDAVEIELEDWMDGNPLIGRGIAYFHTSDLGRKAGEDVAWGHIGYVTYLSQLGILGLLVYGVWFPISTLVLVYSLLRRSGLASETNHLVALTGAMFLYCSFVFALSGSFMNTDGLPGILAGLLIALKTSVSHNVESTQSILWRSSLDAAVNRTA